MQHIIALNVAGAGYSTYAGDPATGLSPQPLGMATPAVSERVLEALQQIDREARRTSHEALVRLSTDPRSPALLLYALHLPDAKDEMGRSGLVFLHGVLLADNVAPGAVFDALRPQLAAEPLLALGSDVARVAREPGDPMPFLRKRCQRIEAAVAATPGPRISLDAGDATIVMPTFATAVAEAAVSSETTARQHRPTLPSAPGRGVVAAAFLLGASVALVPVFLGRAPPVEPPGSVATALPVCDAGVVVVRVPVPCSPPRVAAIDAGASLIADAPPVVRSPPEPTQVVRRPRSPTGLPDARRPNISPPLE